MKLKNMVNQNTPEIIKKLLYGLDYNTRYVVEFYRDTSVEVKEVEIVRDIETNEIMYKEKLRWLYDNFTNLAIYIVCYTRFSFANHNFNNHRPRNLCKF